VSLHRLRLHQGRRRKGRRVYRKEW
jgi:hypothetical protein